MRIGPYVDALTPEQEDRVLTTRMEPGGRCEAIGNPVGCLIQVATGRLRFINCGPWYEYDALCVHFGTERINAAIRNRILANQARRVLRKEVHATA